jgi:hypothetical protein
MLFIVPPNSNSKFASGSMICVEKTTTKFVYLRIYKPITSHFTILNKRCNHLYDGTTYEYEYTKTNKGMEILYDRIKVPAFNTKELIEHETALQFKLNSSLDLSYFVLLESYCGFSFSSGSHNRAKLQEQSERNYHIFNCLSIPRDDEHYLFKLHNNFVGFLEMTKMRVNPVTYNDDPLASIMKKVNRIVRNNLLFVDGRHLFVQYISQDIDIILYTIESYRRNIIRVAISFNIIVPFKRRLTSYKENDGDEEFNFSEIGNAETVIEEYEELLDKTRKYVKKELIRRGNVSMACVLDLL